MSVKLIGDLTFRYIMVILCFWVGLLQQTRLQQEMFTTTAQDKLNNWFALQCVWIHCFRSNFHCFLYYKAYKIPKLKKWMRYTQVWVCSVLYTISGPLCDSFKTVTPYYNHAIYLLCISCLSCYIEGSFPLSINQSEHSWI